MLKNKVYLIVFSLVVGVLFYFLYNSDIQKKTHSHNDSPNLSGEKIKFLVTITQARAARALADWYTKETKAVVQITEIGYDETYRKTLEDIRSSDPQYDIFIIWYPELGDLIRNKALLDLTDWIEENKETIQPQDFIPRIYDAYTLQKGRRWALPFDGDTHVLFYRKSILSKHNLNPPETWDDYLNVSRTITEKEKVNGIYGTAIMSYKAPILILSSFLNRVGGYGGQLLTKDGRPSLDTPEVKMALESLLEQAEYALPSPLETSFEVSRDSFLSGRVAMVEQWTDIGVMAEDNSESTIRGDWGAIQMPKGSGKNAQHAPALNAGFALAISSKAPNLEVAKDFLLFAVRPDIMAKYNVLNGGTDPTRISILKSDDYRKFAPEVSAAAEAALFNATPWPNIPGSRKLMQILSDNIVLALRKKISVENAISDTQKRWTEIIDSTN